MMGKAEVEGRPVRITDAFPVMDCSQKTFSDV
jgi:hypothetical protein